jgi:hypothetical protein
VRLAAFPRILSAATAAVALVGGVAVHAPSAHADGFDVFWCWDDPIVSVGGHLVDIRTEQPLANLLTMRNTSLTVIIPQNVSGGVVLNDVSLFPMTTTVSATGPKYSGTGPIPFTVKATVTATKSYQVKLTALPVLDLKELLAGSTSTQGQSNTTITMQMTVAN